MSLPCVYHIIFRNINSLPHRRVPAGLGHTCKYSELNYEKGTLRMLDLCKDYADLRRVLQDPTLKRMIFEQIPLVGVGQIAMALGTVCWSVVGAQGRYRLATAVEFVGGWFISIPLCVVFVLGFNFNLQGLVACLVFGHCLSGTANAYITFRSPWQKLSDIVVERNKKEKEEEASSEDESDGDGPAL